MWASKVHVGMLRLRKPPIVVLCIGTIVSIAPDGVLVLFLLRYLDDNLMLDSFPI